MPSKLAEVKPCYMREQPVYPTVPKRKNLLVRPIRREVQLAWLAGIVDGEGNLDASVQEKKSGPNRIPYFIPKVRIMNTDMRMIKRISKIYVQEKLIFSYHFSNVQNYKNKKPHWKNALHITVQSHVAVAKLLQLVVPHLVNKKKAALAILKLLKWVMTRPARGRHSAGKSYVFDPRFQQLLKEVKAEKAWHVDPSTSIRRARKILAW